MRTDDKDLIYEGIATCSLVHYQDRLRTTDDKDLIYEGIATIISLPFLTTVSENLIRRQRPDLRRDCDRIMQTAPTALQPHKDDKDLIYEGIATAQGRQPILSLSVSF